MGEILKQRLTERICYFKINADLAGPVRSNFAPFQVVNYSLKDVSHLSNHVEVRGRLHHPEERAAVLRSGQKVPLRPDIGTS